MGRLRRWDLGFRRAAGWKAWWHARPAVMGTTDGTGDAMAAF